MPSSRCYVPSCNSGYDSDRKQRKAEGKKCLSTFSVPKDVELMEKWKKMIPRADKELSEKDRICELHFNVDDIERYYVTKLADGKMHKLERGLPLLRSGAVPCVFPNLPKYLTKVVKKRKSPVNRGPLSKKSKKENVEIECVPDIECLISNSMEPEFSFDVLMKNVRFILKPTKWWGISSHETFIICVKWNDAYFPERKIVIDNSLSIKIFFGDRKVTLTGIEQHISSIDNVSCLLKNIDGYIICAGAQSGKMKNCSGCIPNSDASQGRPRIWCKACCLDRKKLTRIAPKPKPLVLRCRRLYQRIACYNRKNSRLKQKIALLLRKMELARKECALSEVDAISNAIGSLPETQQEAVKACLNAAKAKNSKSIRYTNQWVYECLLMRIKSRKLYDHLRDHKILALPSITTLSKYIKKIRGSYGFQNCVFDCMKQKAAYMDTSDRRGALLVDEMKVSPALSFDRHSLKIQGFVDLGKHTPKNQKAERGDHVLVFMFQPFKGRWIQSLACFLSKGAASGNILHHLIMECIILLENAGFYVDVVTSDGASWNRNMWSQFGITLEKVSCTHVSDPERQLWFISDFPHLIKNIRNAITDKMFMLTPDGPIKTKYWKAVIDIDDPKSYSLKICPKLKYDHVNPKHYQKMNVAMAFQFFSGSVAAAMEVLKTEHPDLEDSSGCVKFLRRIDKIIEIMNSKTPQSALKPNSLDQKAISEFLEYTVRWEKFAEEKKTNFISETTCFGLKVSLKATLQLLQFLATTCDFKYLMTARLNQDSLERFFGIMRHACGSNDHPDAGLFLQVFRLIGTYSLVKPPRGSNISGSEILGTLMNHQDLSKKKHEQDDFAKRLDDILDRGNDMHIFSEDIDHNYNLMNSSDYVVAYVAGYVSRRTKRFTKCEICQEYLFLPADVNEEKIPQNLLINAKNKGGLKKPSLGLYEIIKLIEKSTLTVVSRQPISAETLNDVMDEIEKNENISLVGCLQHQQSFTKRIMHFYLVTRMSFLCSRNNKIHLDKANKTREYRKLSKLS